MRVGDDEIDIKVSSDALLVAEVRMAAGGGPPGLHRHDAAEVYRVDEGELAIYVEDERRVTRAGEVVHIPGGVAHTIRNESDGEARALVVFSPGSEMEAFIRAAAVAAAGRPEDVVALAQRHGIAFVER
ncbi:cupin domain-containing protein [Baekduia sp. Peel2402]|uniref:cupin domain-containing protein n=1 Tax=Baekduia sp. Peel2402 TaxID=3458296 RepID=UPI00403EBD6C